MIKVLTWAVRAALFVLLVAFAARNTEPVTLRFLFDLAWQAPLVALLLAFFVAGAAFGVAAMLGAHVAQRREIARLRREAGAAPASPAAVQPPAAEG